MKILKIIAIALIINSSLFSQSIDSLSKNTKRKMLKIELVNTEGSKFKGIFISSDKEKTIFYNEGLNNFYSIANEDIYKLKLSNKQSFGKSFGNNMIISTAIATAVTMPMFDGEAMMISPQFIIGVLTTIFGIPASLITTGLTRDMDNVNIEYIIDEKNTINDVMPILEKRNKSKFLKEDSEVKKIVTKKNIVALEKIRNPFSYKHPLYVNRFHFSTGSSIVFSNLGNQFKDNLISSDFNSVIRPEKTYIPYAMSYNLGISVNIKNNIRAYARFNGSSEYTQISASTEKGTDRINVENKFSTLGFGAEYILKPVNRVFSKRYELGLNAGFSNNFYDYFIWSYHDHILDAPVYSRTDVFRLKEKHNIPSVELGASFNYYISKNISFQASITGSLMIPYEMTKLECFSVTDAPLNSGDMKVNIFSIISVLGIAYSF